ncbi:metalloendopeptidase OMA1, mitochondrial-like [Palaemon carinicauda]|uniref:metalloendopeptidase OMA1, mitochondrial-like n=1 Tax=Palaemon carinicauda TaxID=392227 RepID=UPI0035B5976D
MFQKWSGFGGTLKRWAITGAFSISLHKSVSFSVRTFSMRRSSCFSLVLQREVKNTCQKTRLFHTSKPRYVNPLLLAILRPLSKVTAILVGRGFRKWWQSLPAKKRALFIQHFLRNKYKYLGGSALLGTASYTYYDEHVVPAPLTGRRRFMVFTPDQLHAIARHQYTEEVSQYAHLLMPENHPMVSVVKRIGESLLQANKNIPQLYTKSWTVTVIDDPNVNCYVLPSGDIVMFRGMMDLLENDDQIAAVLAHEMSHAILEHASEQLSRGYLLDVLILLPLAVIWAFIPSDGLALVTQWFLSQVVTVLLKLPYSRSLEEEADSVGLQLAAKACYDVREASAFWGKMCILDKIREKQVGSSPEDAVWLSTHPSNIERQEKIDAKMEEAISIRNFCHCPRLDERDPRQMIKILQKQLAISSSNS